MIKKIVVIAISIVLISNLAQAQSDFGLKFGFGMLADSGNERFRILLGGDGALNVIDQEMLFFQLGLDGELSYQWYNFEDENISNYDIKMLLDFTPAAGINLGGIIKPSLGGGFTFGVNAERYSYSSTNYYGSYDYEITALDIMYGLNLQPCLALEFHNLFAKTRIKYRFLFENTHLESKGIASESDDYKLNTQSLTFILSAGIKSGNLSLEGGIQAENWISKHKDYDNWPKWPEDWEFLLFLRLGKAF